MTSRLQSSRHFPRQLDPARIYIVLVLAEALAACRAQVAVRARKVGHSINVGPLSGVPGAGSVGGG
jgi:hypothetical protein